MSGFVDPTREQFTAFRELKRDGIVHMLNLVRFRDRAAYAEGRTATGGGGLAADHRSSIRLCLANALGY